jgi:hypothetical protein
MFGFFGLGIQKVVLMLLVGVLMVLVPLGAILLVLALTRGKDHG